MKNKKTAALLIGCNIVISCFVSVYAAGNPIEVNFGTELTKQEQDGYAALEGNNAYDYYQQAKSEFPNEIPVLDSFEVKGENVFFVATDGNDENDGTISSPLATVNEALERISEQDSTERSGGNVIYLREGEYFLSEPVDINSAHTSSDSSLFISAYNNEKAVFTVNKNIPLSKAQKVTRDNTDLITYSRINDNAIDNLYYISYEDMGMSEIPYESVFYMNDMAMYPARYPNQGEDSVGSVIKDGSYKDSEGMTKTGLPMEWTGMDDRPFTWKDTGNIHIFGRMSGEWAYTDGVVWFDRENKTINSTSSLTTSNNPIATNFWGSISCTYYYANVFEELDSAGEWFADEASQRFYFYLADETEKYKSNISYKGLDEYVINIKNAENTVINNINIVNVCNGISISESKAVIIQDCKISNSDSTAIKMYNTDKCGVLNSDIRNINESYAVIIDESSERMSELIPRRNFVQNSYIGNASRGVQLTSTGSIFSHNLMENTRYSSATVYGAENIIERNEFSGVCNKITDMGGVYIGGSIINRGHTVRYNYFHDSKPDSKNARAVYCDDCSDMSWIYGNVIRNFSYGVFLHSGDDHVVEDNVVINADTYIRNSFDYAYNESLMKNYFFKASPQFIVGYTENKIGNSTTWHTRYKGILKEKYDQTLEAKEAYNSDSDMFRKVFNVVTGKNKASDYDNADAVQKVYDLVTDTGCYYLNNKYVVPGSSYSWGYGPSAYCGPDNVCEPDNDGKPYVTYLADKQATDSYDVSNLTADIGLKSYSGSDDEKPKLYQENNKEFSVNDFTGVSWSVTSNCSYYRAEIATDSNFENIVISYDTANNEYPLYKYIYDSTDKVNKKVRTSDYEFETDKPYFVRVTAVSLAECISENNHVSDTVCFILRNNIESKRDKADLKSYYGKTGKRLVLRGAIHDYLLRDEDKQVTVIMYEEGDNAGNAAAIKHIAQINPNKDGSFEYSFSEELTDKTRIKIKIGSEDITDRLFKENALSIEEEFITNTYYGKNSLKLGLKGSVPNYLLRDEDKQITMLMYEEGNNANDIASIKHIAQINPDENGEFEYIFDEAVTDKTRIKIKAGSEDITDKLFKSSTSEITEISFTSEISDTGDIMTAAANVNNILGITDECEIIIASYSGEGTLIGCKTVKSNKIKTGDTVSLSNEYSIPEEAKTVKAFIWNVSDMKPLN